MGLNERGWEGHMLPSQLRAGTQVLTPSTALSSPVVSSGFGT